MLSTHFFLVWCLPTFFFYSYDLLREAIFIVGNEMKKIFFLCATMGKWFAILHDHALDSIIIVFVFFISLSFSLSNILSFLFVLWLNTHLIFFK